MLNDNASRKIFVSYKYKDRDVLPLTEYTPTEDTDFLYTPRHYVDKIIDTVGVEHIYKGEMGDEDIGHLSDDTIDSKLKEKIFDSSVTIVLISPNMWVKTKTEKEQWIPNEIAYSLRDKTRGEKTSKTNGMLAVILPDVNGSYDYAVTKHHCTYCDLTVWHTDRYFTLLRNNMFNKNNKNLTSCNYCNSSSIHKGSDHSYIYPVKWEQFIGSYNDYINHALALRDRLDAFELQKLHE